MGSRYNVQGLDFDFKLVLGKEHLYSLGSDLFVGAEYLGID